MLSYVSFANVVVVNVTKINSNRRFFGNTLVASAVTPLPARYGDGNLNASGMEVVVR